MRRRTFLTASAAPRIANARDSRVLKFIPRSNVAILDPIWTTAYVPRNHRYLVFDPLFGTDGAAKASPWMADGMTSDDDGKLVRMTPGDGLQFRDGTPVLARDCVAGIRRWPKRDTFGGTLMLITPISPGC
jgi:peptide/nickel transport system substrate-binding protein